MSIPAGKEGHGMAASLYSSATSIYNRKVIWPFLVPPSISLRPYKLSVSPEIGGVCSEVER